MLYGVLMKRTAATHSRALAVPSTPSQQDGLAEFEPLTAISIDFGDGRISLAGIYKKQQTSFDVHQIRYYMQEDGYGYKITDLLGSYIVGPHGIQVDFGDEQLQDAWDNHEWNPEQPEEGFAEIQRFMIMQIARDGESLYQISADMDNFYLNPIDMLDLPLSSRGQIASGMSAIAYTTAVYSGIDRDSMRRPVRYNFWPQVGQPFVLSADFIVHSYVKKFAGQERGLSWFLGALDTMKELSEFEKNVAQAVKNAAADPGHYVVPPRYFPDINPEDAVSLTRAAELLNKMVSKAPDKRGVLPSDIDYKPSDVGNIFQGTVGEMYRKAALSRIAACVGMAYHSVSGDLSTANFSSLQQSNLDTRALYRKTQDKILAAVKRIVKMWLRWQALRSSRMDTKARRACAKYLLPPFEYIDRAKAVQADAKLLEIGASAPSLIIRTHGQDPDEVFELQAEDELKRRKAYEKRGLEYPGDKVTNQDLTKPEDDDKVEDGDDDKDGKDK